jgi:hypothetical protein
MRQGRLAAALSLILPLAACGQSDDRAAVRATAQAFLAAVSDKDGGAACATLSGDTRLELESAEQQPCAQAVTGLGLAPATVVRVEVDVVNAKIYLSSGESLFAGRTDGGWKLAAIGCKPDGDPTDHPMDCEVTA